MQRFEARECGCGIEEGGPKLLLGAWNVMIDTFNVKTAIERT